jgi:hypothetical protein
MLANLLQEYGLKCVGTVELVDGIFVITFDEGDAKKLETCIYAFLVGDEIIRFGSSKRRLGTRMREYERHLSAALCGQKSSASPDEAKQWAERLAPGIKGTLWARGGTVIVTPVGELNVYLAEESHLIGLHLPKLNRSKHR